MPVKRRIAKRRSLSPEAEMDAWRETFSSGFDFGDLEVLGLSGEAAFGLRAPCPGDAERRQRDQATLTVAREAWQRLGAAFMASWEPEPYLPAPWALEAFGEPSHAV